MYKCVSFHAALNPLRVRFVWSEFHVNPYHFYVAKVNVWVLFQMMDMHIAHIHIIIIPSHSILFCFCFFSILLTAVVFMFSCVAIFFYLMCFPTMYLLHSYSWPDENCILPYGFRCGIFSVYCIAYAVHERGSKSSTLSAVHIHFKSFGWSMGSGRSVRSFYGSLHIFNQKLILPLWSHLNVFMDESIYACALHCSAHCIYG